MENTLAMEMGMRIADTRRAHNVTQEALSEMLDVSPKHISHTECGTSSLSLKILLRFLMVLHKSYTQTIQPNRID